MPDPLFRAGATALFVIALAAVAVAQSQQRAYQVYLPQEPYKYTAAMAPAGLDVSLLRTNATQANPITDHGATLGRVLFYDKRLSRNERVSCASCHKQSRGFADVRAKSFGFKKRRTKRNSMGLTNLLYHRSGKFFWDERGATLEQMVLMPIQDRIEMGMDLPALVARLTQDTQYRWLFRQAFGSSEVTSARIGKALAQFIRSMVSFRSRFDEGYAQAKSLDDKFKNFTTLENRGKTLFLGVKRPGKRRTSCGACHIQEPGDPRNGRKAPLLFQGIGLANNGLDRGDDAHGDEGRAEVTRRMKDKGMFRMPTMRNIMVSGPYMHDGRLRTMEDVLRFYGGKVREHPSLDDRLITLREELLDETRTGGGWGGGGNLLGRRQPFRQLGFPITPRDRSALQAFLKTLTDQEFLRDPRFADPFVKPRRKHRRVAHR